MTRRALEAVLDQNRIRPKGVMEISRYAIREEVAADLGAAVVSRTEFVLDDRPTGLPIGMTTVRQQTPRLSRLKQAVRKRLRTDAIPAIGTEIEVPPALNDRASVAVAA
jgi:hypothetical protein